MVQNFLQLVFKNASTGATVDTITLTTDEVPAGVTRNVPVRINSFTTVEGRGRMFPAQDGVEFSFTVVMAADATVRKLDLINTYVALGYTVDATALIGALSYNVTFDRLEYNSGQASIVGGVVMSMEHTHRQMVSTGLRDRVEIPFVIRQGGATALPLAANYVGN